MKTSISLVVLSLLVGACGDGSEGGLGGAIGSEREEISAGKLVPITGHSAPDTSVVKLYLGDLATANAGNPAWCNALKVGPRTFWTAAACVEHVAVGGTIAMTNNLSGDFAGKGAVTIASADMHPTFKNYRLAPYPLRPAHYDVGRFTLTADTPDIPVYSLAHPDWVPIDATVTYTSYGQDIETFSHAGQKQYAFFSLVSAMDYAESLDLSPSEGDAAYAYNMLTSYPSGPGSFGHPRRTSGDFGAPVFQKFGTTWATWKMVGIVPMTGFGTLFARYSNVRNWLSSPTVNLFQPNIRGFIFNRRTGRCIGTVPLTANVVQDQNCMNGAQDTDRQSWRLVAWGSDAGAFQLVNGNGSCLEAVASSPSTVLKHKPCVAPGVGTVAQRWTFPNSNHADYKQLRSGLGSCVSPSNPAAAGGSLVVSACGNQDEFSWVMTN